MSQFEDPAFLPAQCRDPNARRLLAEAVHCHQAGAQRAAVVSIWIAVVYDLFGKLRELAQIGDPNARKSVEQIDKIVTRHDVPAAQKLESTILQDARDRFALISANEHQDLLRLYEDRHRCAHPSLNRPEEMYVPAPELVRLHLRNAVVHLLSQPPVQGRSALDQLQREIDSELFPKSISDAAEYLRGGVYRRMKPALLRDFCNAVVASCIGDVDTTAIQFARRVRGLMALRTFNYAAVNDSLRDRLTSAARRAPETNFHRLIQFVAVTDSAAHLNLDVRLRVQTYIENAPVGELPSFISHALAVSEFTEAASARVQEIGRLGLQEVLLEYGREEPLVVREPRPELLDRVVQLYVESGSWRTANSLASTLVVPHAGAMSDTQIGAILSAFASNVELYKSSTRAEVLRALHATALADDALMAAALENCDMTVADLGEEDESSS